MRSTPSGRPRRFDTAYEQVLVDMTDAESATRGYVLTGEMLVPRAVSSSAGNACPRDMRTLDRSHSGFRGEPRTWWPNLRGLVNQRLSILQTMQLLAPINDRHEPRPAHRADDRPGQDVMDEIRDLLAREEAATARALVDRQRTLDASHRRSFLIGIVGMPIGRARLLDLDRALHRATGRRGSVAPRTIARLLDEGMPLGKPSGSDDELGQLERVLVRSGTRVVELQGELRRMGTSDALTRLMNRRGFLPTAEHQLAVAQARPSDHGVDVPRPGRSQARERHARPRRGRRHDHRGGVRAAGDVPGRRT